MAQSILLICSEDHRPAVRDLSSFLWDVAMLHDRLVIYWRNPTDPLLYSPNFYRRWRRLPEGLELRLGIVSRQSPIEIELIVAITGSILLAAKAFSDILLMIRDWQYEQDKHKLEILDTKLGILEKIEGLRKASPELLILLDSDIHRILSNRIRIKEIEESEFRED